MFFTSVGPIFVFFVVGCEEFYRNIRIFKHNAKTVLSLCHYVIEASRKIIQLSMENIRYCDKFHCIASSYHHGFFPRLSTEPRSYILTDEFESYQSSISFS